FRGLVPGLLALAKSSATGAQLACIRDATAAAREILAGANDEMGAVVVVRFDATSMKSPPANCLKTLGDIESIRVEGAREAYRAGRMIVVVETGFLIIGEKPATVAAALAGRGKGASFGDVALHGDEYVSFHRTMPQEHFTAHGALSESNEQFRIAAEFDLPN